MSENQNINKTIRLSCNITQPIRAFLEHRAMQETERLGVKITISDVVNIELKKAMQRIVNEAINTNQR